jgi:hypothetical protein
MARGRNPGSPDRPLPWRTYRDSSVREAAKRVNLVLSLPPEHFEAARFRRDLRNALFLESPPRPRRA